jgi:hypothetical protein
MLLGVIVKSDNKWFGESNENALEMMKSCLHYHSICSKTSSSS